MLVVSGLAKRHPGASRSVFRALSLTLAATEVVALVGESGVGKSTLLNCIAGLEDADAGQILVAGQDMASASEAARAGLRASRIGFVFQAFHVLPTLSVAQNVAIPLLLNGIHDMARVSALLEQVGLAGFEARQPASLSGGELQRVAIARALVHRPALILADEPTGNLDPKSADDVLNLLIGQSRAQGAATLIVTHSAHVAQRCDRVLTLGPDGLT
jgi:putative ABC transport system ATP-binding protein